MRLETNLKRTIPTNTPITNTDSDETWYTNSYTLGSLQTNNDNRLPRYPDSSLPLTPNHKPSHVSIHQRFCSTSSSDMSESSPNNIQSNNEHNIPTMRVPTQPVYVTTHNQQSINIRQRSRSEDMLSSKDLSIGETTNIDDNNLSQLEQNQSLNQLEQEQEQENNLSSNENDFQLPNTIMKNLDENFIRTTEASVNYATPTQTYSAYSCEYARPHRNQLTTSPKSELLSPRNSQQQQENDIQYSTPPSSTFIPVHPSINNYYPQQPIPPPSYGSMYTQNNLNQTPYSDDPM
jgi:hypothetical protein